MGGVFANAGKLLHFCNCVRELAAVLFHDQPGGRMQISGAGVIAEALPGVKHIVLLRPCQRGKGWKSAQPLFIIREHRSDLGLLKHRFGNQDRVRIIGSSPGKIAAVLAIPGQKTAPKLRRIHLQH